VDFNRDRNPYSGMFEERIYEKYLSYPDTEDEDDGIYTETIIHCTLCNSNEFVVRGI